MKSSWDSLLGLGTPKSFYEPLVQKRLAGWNGSGWVEVMPRDDIIVAGRDQIKGVTADGNQVLTDDPERLRM